RARLSQSSASQSLQQARGPGGDSELGGALGGQPAGRFVAVQAEASFSGATECDEPHPPVSQDMLEPIQLDRAVEAEAGRSREHARGRFRFVLAALTLAGRRL